jgi:serine phosphatase RsbU (regulator of sigma subunit)
MHIFRSGITDLGFFCKTVRVIIATMKDSAEQSNPFVSLLYRTARRFWPEMEEMNQQRQMVAMGDVLITLLTAPLAALGLIWLLMVTDWQIVRQNWLLLLVFGCLLYLFTRMSYFFIVEIRADRYGSAEGSLDSMMQWSAAFLFGPSALWLTVISRSATYIWSWRKPHSKATGWSRLRSLSQELSIATVAYLLALSLYQRIGGTFPLPELSLKAMLPALLALFVHFLVVLLIWLPYIAYSIWVQITLTYKGEVAPLLKFLMLALGLPLLFQPFAILVAGLYIEESIWIALFFVFGLLLVAYIGRQLSWAAETSRQQSRQLEKLETLWHDITNAPPDASTLPFLLDEHLPAMFPSSRVAVWMSTSGYLYKNPTDWQLEIEPIWTWVSTKNEAQAFLANHLLPWGLPAGRHDPVVVTPILNVDDGKPTGCVYIELRSLAQPWDIRALQSLFPAVQSLGAFIASVLHQAEVYTETLEYQSAMQELEFAGRIQASFLPNELPSLDGWELAVSFMPAREISGDFFDFIPLPENKAGILIADVADKGLGAALYMALSRTLIRTYALEFEASPDITFFSANERVLRDARANLFVTAFYGVLDRDSGVLSYCNAGHSSPLLLSRRNGGTIHVLTPTGMPIGINEDATWEEVSIQVEPGDILILYTDGIPDAQNPEGEFFNEQRIIDLVRQQLDSTAHEIQSSLLHAVQQFSAGAAQFDDITLLVIKRELTQVETLVKPQHQGYYE